jgi:hypothetical protein
MPRLQSTLDSASQKASSLNDHLNRRLLAYVATASAAGVSVLAMTQSAEAKVVYTPADRVIVSDSRLDLNNDGIPDYAFHSNFQLCGTCGYFEAKAIKFNKFMTNGGQNGAPLASGVSIGPDGKFRGDAASMVNGCTCSGHSAMGGPWYGVQNEYMGFEFNIEGAAHFGWARFSVTKVAITLTGYAYETISLKPIVTGDTEGADEDSVAEPDPAASRSSALGSLALGTAGRSAQDDAK